MATFSLPTDDFDSNARAIMPLMSDLGENLSIMQKMMKQIGTNSDTEEERRKFLTLANETRQTVSQVTKLMRKLPVANPHLENEVSEYSSTLRRIMEQFRDKATKYPPHKPKLTTETHPLLLNTNEYDNNNNNNNNMANSYPYQYSQQSNQYNNNNKNSIFDNTYMTQVTIHNESKMLEETESKMSDIVQTLEETHEIFNDLREMAVQGQDTIDVLETNVISGKESVIRGKNELLKGEKHLKKARRNRCMLLFILIIALAALVCVVWAIKKN